ncbi:MAG: hypothetical protein M3Z37_00060 [Candidatus Eremiobacteraeota bacterium]|nr:hypothetical protein [Candidatus Eremiobacteraeota bacterium]
MTAQTPPCYNVAMDDEKDRSPDLPENPYGPPAAGGDVPPNDVVNKWPAQKIIEDNDRRMERSLDAPVSDTDTAHERPD